MTGGLQQQRGLADARLAAEQHKRTRHDAAAKHAIELADAGGEPRGVSVLDLCVQLRTRAGTELCVPVFHLARRSAVRREGGALLDERIPGPQSVHRPPTWRLRHILTHEEGFWGFSSLKPQDPAAGSLRQGIRHGSCRPRDRCHASLVALDARAEPADISKEEVR